MAWDHNALMSFVPYEMPDLFGGTSFKIGVAVMPKGPDNVPVGALAQMVAPYSGMNPEAKHLILAAPLMYQTLAATAGLMRKLNDEIDTLVSAGHVKEDTMRDLVKCYDAVERECLTAMSIAVQGVDAVATGLKKELKR